MVIQGGWVLDFSAAAFQRKDIRVTGSRIAAVGDCLKAEEGEEIITKLQNWANENFPAYDLRIVGSIIAAQAYPGDVVGMTPAPGYERVAPNEKRMSLDKFTVFMK